MNKALYRLVFSRRCGMLMAVAEHALAGGKTAGGERRGPLAFTLAAATAALGVAGAPALAQTRPPVVFASQLPAPKFNLPQPFTTLMQDPARRGFATPIAGSGTVKWTVEGNTLTLDQGNVDQVLLNWQSFDIAAGYSVRFVQNKDPSRYVSALNRVWSTQPSQILGSLTADREVILVNSQGVYFGRGAQVSAGKFVASALSVSDATFQRGLRNVTDGSAVFTTAPTDYQATNLSDSAGSRSAAVSVEAGAEIRTAAGGDVLLVAPRVVNEGRIETPGGQTVLAAGSKVYLMSSSDPAQRGLIVAVDPIKLADGRTNDPDMGIAENAAKGSFKTVDGAPVPDSTPDNTSGLVTKLNEIRAASGTVNLVGLTVRQNGVINATTAVKGANGAIYLQSMASTVALSGDPGAVYGAATRGVLTEPGSTVRFGSTLGTVRVGASSVTSVQPDASGATQLDAEVFNPSLVRIEGAAISVEAGAQVLAPAGKIDLLASQSADNNPLFFSGQGGAGVPDASRIVIAPGATLSVAGLTDVAVDGARNQGSQRLFRIELANSPVQRSGPLYRSQVYFDNRDASKITAADVSGAAASLARTASEHSTAGGRINIQSDGAVVLGDGATLDVSGGSVQYSPTKIRNTLLSQSGRVVAFKSALPGTQVDSLLTAPQETLSPAYNEGADGGALLINGRQLALAGNLGGQTLVGDRQRAGTSAVAAPATLEVGTRSGSLYYLAGLALSPDAPLAIDASIFQDPLQPTLAGLTNTAGLSLPKVAAGGFGGLTLRAQRVSQPSFGALDLGAGGSFAIEANSVALDAAITATGGRISVLTPSASGNADVSGDGDIHLSAASRLDTSGRWINDTVGAQSAPTTGSPIAGGSVALNSAHSLIVDSGASIDVSGGAVLSSKGGLKQGKAGSVALTTGTDPTYHPRLALAGVTLRGFDFGGGGKLVLGAPNLTISGAGASGFSLDPSFFSASGFGNITINAQGDIRVPSGISLAPRLLNWQLANGYGAVPSDLFSDAVATPQLVDPALASRSPVSLTLAAKRPLFFGGSDVVVERGASISLDPGGSLGLSATRGISVGSLGGTPGQTSELSTPGGVMALSITGNRGGSPDQDPDGFVGTQAIWLGADARLSANGVAQLRKDTSAPAQIQFAVAGEVATPVDERRTGTVLAGGTITLNAARGYVVAEAGSTLSLDGATALLNVPGLAQAVQVAKPAGTLNVSSPEGFAIDGTVSARAPVDAAGKALADGGRLNMGLGIGGLLTTSGNPDQPFSSAPRTLVIGDHDGLLAARHVAPGTDLSLTLGNGTGFVRNALLQNAGFSGMRLGAGDAILFESSLRLDASLGLQLNAPALSALPGAQVSLTTTYAQIGDASLARQGAAPDTSARPDASPLHDTQLSVAAQNIDVYGNTGLQGFSSVTLDAGRSPMGEIRFSAAAPTFARLESLRRGLNFSGDLRLTAGQLYATTATQYTLNGRAATGPDDAGSRLIVRPAAGGSHANEPLSVYGSLTVKATDIDQGGVLQQPFGQINLLAERTLTLGDGSLTSVSGLGASEIFGQTINLAQWAVPGGDAYLPLFNSKSIKLGAANILTSSSAVVSASGGGTIKAWEFFPGVGGSRDYFDTAGLYAVLPDYAATQTLSLVGGIPATADIKQLVVTMSGSGLTPGTYTLMPARYALLAGDLPKGAFLVSLAADQGKSVLRSPILQADGSVIISGYTISPGSTNVGTVGERWAIEPAATFEAKGDVRLSNVSNLLAANAAAQGQSRPALPLDGGLVQVSARGSDRSLWSAKLELAAAGGQAGQLDFASTSVALVDDLAKTPSRAFGISADTIATSGAGSVLLGGLRSLDSGKPASDAPTWNVDDSGTTRVRVDLGRTALQTEELLLASSGTLSLAAGTTISANAIGTLGARTLAIRGDGVIAAISADALQVQRSSVRLAGGNLELGAGSVLTGPQVNLDATGAMQIDRSVGLQAQTLALGARRLVIGDGATSDPAATVLGGDLLAAVRSTPDLRMRAYGSIDFVGDQNWSQRPAATAAQPDPAAAVVQRSLVLDAPVVRGLPASSGAAAHADIAAQDIAVRNTTGQSPGQGVAGEGTLVLQALPPVRYGNTGGLTLGPGALALGFDSATLRSAGDIVLQGSGRTTAQQDLVLSGARLTAGTAAQQTLAAAGTLRMAQEAGSRSLAERVGQGASVTLSATTVQQNGVVDLPGGQLSLQAKGATGNDAALSFGPGSSTSVAGFALAGPDGFVAFGTAGSIQADATQGRIEVLGKLDVSAARRPDGSAGEGDAGSIELHAAGAGGQVVLSRPLANGAVGNGSLQGSAGGAEGDLGGRLVVDVAAMPRADALAQAAGDGGMTRELTLRVRSGDVALDQGIQAQHISLSADTGSLAVGVGGASPITLAAGAPAGGVVQLAAGQDLVLGAAARIDARSSREGANGGDILLASTNGRVRLSADAVVDAGGMNTADGRIVLRALRGNDARSVNVDPLNTAHLKAGEVDIEAVRTYTNIQEITGGNSIAPGTLSQSALRANDGAYMNSKQAVLSALGVSAAESTSGRVNLRVGTEVRSDFDLTITDDWVFSGTPSRPTSYRPGGDAGFLTLRAAGNLFMDGSLSDGFTSAGLLNDNARSWSYRLTAGADLQAANPLAVRDLSAGSEETGNLTIAGAKWVRTGAGSIELAAGRDVAFMANEDGSPSPGAYVAGRKMAGSAAVLSTLFSGQALAPTFTEQGGRLDVSAARDVTSPEATQLINNWFWRSGLLSTRAGEAGLYAQGRQLAWWTQFSSFGQTFGSFGGGNLTVRAGRDIVNVQAMAPTIGWADSRMAASANLRVINGGDVSAAAGRDILGGQFFLGRGDGRLDAGNTIGLADQNGLASAPLLALMDGAWRLSARGGVTLGSAFNPTATPALAGPSLAGLSGYFYTWGSQAALRVSSNAGDIKLRVGVTETIGQGYGLDIDQSSDTTFQVMPATLVATAAGGNIDLLSGDSQSGAILFPSSAGQLKLWSGGDVLLGGAERPAQLAMSDSAPTDWPQPSAPAGRAQNPIVISLIPNTLNDLLPLTSLHADDSEPVRIHAEGSLQIRGASTSSSTLLLPKPAQLSAGVDVVELSLRGQNLSESDQTTITAGRNFTAGQFGNVELAGPGALSVDAGRSVDLGSSAGITTTGNLSNAKLPSQGASVRVAAATAGVLDLVAFDASYLNADPSAGSPRSTQYRLALVNYVEQALKQANLSYDQAWSYFKGFPPEAQATFGRQVLAAEFGAVYLSGPAPTAAQMTATLNAAFEQRKAQVLQAGDAALAAGEALTLPGREVLRGAELTSYLAQLRALNFSSLALDSTVAARVANLTEVQRGWREAVAASLGGSAASFDALAAQNPQDPRVAAYRSALTEFSGSTFQTYRDTALASEVASSGAAASLFGRLSLPMRLALFDQGSKSAELAGAGSFVAQPVWPGEAPAFAYNGTLNMTQSSVVTERGGDISLINAGGAINVGLKDTAGGTSTPKGVIALGGGNIFGYAKGDFQVNTQRVFIVGQGNMNIWSSSGDIDSGRGANTAVAAPPLAARRTVDGVVFEVPATTTGSGLGILADARGQSSGTIGLYPAFGEILALDAYIRAPSVVLGSAIKGADNLISASVGGAAAAVSAPPVAVAPPAASNENKTAAGQTGTQSPESRPRSSLLTVELLGLGAAPEDEVCDDKERRDGKCPKPARKCSDEEKTAGKCP